MIRVKGVDHISICVSDFERSKVFYTKVLGALGFKLKHDLSSYAGWSNGKTLYWITQADSEGRKRKFRAGDVGLHHYAFELSKRSDVDEFYQVLKANDVEVVDPPNDHYEGGYYAVYFLDPDGMKLESMVFDPKGLRKAQEAEKKAPKARKKRR